VSISLGLGMLVTAQPFVAEAFPSWAHIIFGSGITLGALSAIVLNIVFNHLGGMSNTAVAGRPTDHLVTLAEVNAMNPQQFATIFGGLVENTPWVLDRAYAMRPFSDTLALRSAFHEALLTGTPDEQLLLMNSFADLGSDEEANDTYSLDHANAGIGGLMDTERDEVVALAQIYRARFHFPLIVCAREVDRYERVLSTGWARLPNAAAVERSAGLIEIAKIANYQFDELVANANPIATAQFDRFAKLAA
jgi:OHCU decarboxylase